jgi:hypothetical protein
MCHNSGTHGQPGQAVCNAVCHNTSTPARSLLKTKHGPHASMKHVQQNAASELPTCCAVPWRVGQSLPLLLRLLLSSAKRQCFISCWSSPAVSQLARPQNCHPHLCCLQDSRLQDCSREQGMHCLALHICASIARHHMYHLSRWSSRILLNTATTCRQQTKNTCAQHPQVLHEGSMLVLCWVGDDQHVVDQIMQPSKHTGNGWCLVRAAAQ